MTQGERDTESQAAEFVRQGEMAPTSLIGDVLHLLKNNKKWWMLPLIVILLALGALMILGTTGAAPLIYALF